MSGRRRAGTRRETNGLRSGDDPSRQSHERNGSGRSRRRDSSTQPTAPSRHGRLKTAYCLGAGGVANRWSDGSGELAGEESERPRGQTADGFFNELKSQVCIASRGKVKKLCQEVIAA